MKYLVFIFLFYSIITSSSGKNESKIKRKRNQFNIEYIEIHKSTKEFNGQYLKMDRATKDTLVFGNYLNGVKTGIWSYYGIENELFFKYDHDENRITRESFYLSSIDSFIVNSENNEFELSDVE